MSAHVIFNADHTRAAIAGTEYAPHDRLPDGEQAGLHVARWAINHRRTDDERRDAARYLAHSADWRALAGAIGAVRAGSGKKSFTPAERRRRSALLATARAKRWPAK